MTYSDRIYKSRKWYISHELLLFQPESAKGLRDLVLIYDELEDGAELEWHDLRKDVSELARMVKPKRQMQAFNVRRIKQ